MHSGKVELWMHASVPYPAALRVLHSGEMYNDMASRVVPLIWPSIPYLLPALQVRRRGHDVLQSIVLCRERGQEKDRFGHKCAMRRDAD